jgi:molybdopterin biosynthesis enzyme MoaB
MRSLPNSHSISSRYVTGIYGMFLINLPPNPRSAKENPAVILPALKHAFEILNEDDPECASP